MQLFVQVAKWHELVHVDIQRAMIASLWEKHASYIHIQSNCDVMVWWFFRCTKRHNTFQRGSLPHIVRWLFFCPPPVFIQGRDRGALMAQANGEWKKRGGTKVLLLHGWGAPRANNGTHLLLCSALLWEQFHAVGRQADRREHNRLPALIGTSGRRASTGSTHPKPQNMLPFTYTPPSPLLLSKINNAPCAFGSGQTACFNSNARDFHHLIEWNITIYSLAIACLAFFNRTVKLCT